MITFYVGPSKTKISTEVSSIPSIFHDIITSNWKESTTNTIHLPTISPLAFMPLLNFLKNEPVELTGDIILECIYLSNLYMVTGFNLFCIDYLKENINDENVHTILNGGIDIGDKGVVQVVLDYVVNHAEAFFESDMFLEVRKEGVMDVIGLRKLGQYEEVRVLGSLVQWIKANSEGEVSDVMKDFDEYVYFEYIDLRIIDVMAKYMSSEWVDRARKWHAVNTVTRYSRDPYHIPGEIAMEEYSGWAIGGFMFDIEAIQDIKVRKLYAYSRKPGYFDFTVYGKRGTHIHFEEKPDFWEIITPETNLNCKGQEEMSQLMDTEIELLAGETYAIYVDNHNNESDGEFVSCFKGLIDDDTYKEGALEVDLENSHLKIHRVVIMQRKAPAFELYPGHCSAKFVGRICYDYY